MKKIKGNGTAQGKKKKGGKKKKAKTDTNKPREEIVAFCPRERGAGRFWAETVQENFIAPELSKVHTLLLP